jgi:hypothetical protein
MTISSIIVFVVCALFATVFVNVLGADVKEDPSIDKQVAVAARQSFSDNFFRNWFGNFFPQIGGAGFGGKQNFRPPRFSPFPRFTPSPGFTPFPKLPPFPKFPPFPSRSPFPGPGRGGSNCARPLRSCGGGCCSGLTCSRALGLCFMPFPQSSPAF